MLLTIVWAGLARGHSITDTTEEGMVEEHWRDSQLGRIKIGKDVSLQHCTGREPAQGLALVLVQTISGHATLCYVLDGEVELGVETELDTDVGLSGQALLCKLNQLGISVPNMTASKIMISPTTADDIALLDAAILCSLPQDVARISPPTTIPITATAIPNAVRTPIILVRPPLITLTTGSLHKALGSPTVAETFRRRGIHS